VPSELFASIAGSLGPAAVEAGYAFNGDRIYWNRNDQGDVAYVEFQESDGSWDDTPVWYVNLYVNAHVFQEFRKYKLPPTGGSVAGMWDTRLEAPAEFRRRPQLEDKWRAEGVEGVSAACSALIEAMHATGFPWLAERFDPASRHNVIMREQHPHHLLAELVDDGPDDLFADALNAYRGLPSVDEHNAFLTYIIERRRTRRN
jgi:hypothetical protein